MNELIEGLWKHFMCNPLVDGGYTKKDGFIQAIQTACKAQRSACSRVYNISDEPCYEQIENAEIERQDYE